MARVRTTIDKSGPFFTKDPTKSFEQNARRMMDSMAAAAETEARSLAAPWSPGHSGSGDFEEGIVGRTHRLDGAPFKHPGMVVSQTHVYPWKNAGARQYRGGKLEASRHVFRLTGSRMRGTRKVNVAELLKDLQ